MMGEAKRKPHGTIGTGNNEWFTPSKYVELARTVLGAIDLDPASNPIAQEVVRAGCYFTKTDDGLSKEWHGRIWLNPPYAQPLISQFVDRLIEERRAGRVDAAILLTYNYTDTVWFARLGKAADAVCFTRGQIKFYGPNGEKAAPARGSAFTYFGSDVKLFTDVFREIGFVGEPWRGAVQPNSNQNRAGRLPAITTTRT